MAPFFGNEETSHLEGVSHLGEGRGAESPEESPERERLAALHRYEVLDTPPEESFDRLTRLAADRFDVPVALIGLIGGEQHWFKSCYGFERRHLPREVSFCTHALEAAGGQSEGIMVVEDTAEDARFADNPLVTGAPGVRFYAGALLSTPDGYRIGTLCLWDTAPRSFGPGERGYLKDLAAIAMGALELRRQAAASTRSEAALARQVELEKTVVRVSEELLSGPDDLQAVLATLGKAVEATQAYLFRLDSEGAQRMVNTHGWRGSGTSPSRMAEGQSLDLTHFPWWFERLQTEEVVRIRVPELPSEAEAERTLLQKNEVGALLDVTIRLSDGTLYGHLGFGDIDADRAWSEGEVRLLRVVSDLLAGHFEREQRKEALRKSEERLRSVIANTRDIIFQTDAEGRYTFLSPAWEESMGYTVEESLGTRFIDYLEDEESSVEAYRSQFEGHEQFEKQGRFIEHSSRYVARDGTARWMRVRDQFMYDADGEVTGVTGTLSDITDSVQVEAEREARRRAEELLEAKTSFLNNMSHELRTPLTSILGFAEVLATQGEGAQQEFARRIAEGGRRLQRTLDSVLSLAQLEGGSAADLDLEPIDVGKVVRETTEAHRAAAEGKGLSLQAVVPEQKTVRARANAGALQRVLDNLVGNAIKFTEQGGVTVAVEPGDEAVHIRVRDTGIGIGEAFREKLFEDFQQESSGLGRLHEGAGLGLAIVKRLTELMKGTIEVESAPGRGSTFTVRVPRAVPVAATDLSGPGASPKASVSSGSSSDAKAHLLVVEDNPNTRTLAEYILGKHYVVESAADGGALQLLTEERPFDAFLIDINLGPHESGVDLLKRLRAEPAGENVPAIAFTAHATVGDEERLLEAGFEGYLAKPFTRRALLEAVERVLP